MDSEYIAEIFNRSVQNLIMQIFGIIRAMLPQLLAITGVLVAIYIGIELIKKYTVPKSEEYGMHDPELGKYGYQDGFEDIAEAREYGDWDDYDDDREHAAFLNSYEPGSWSREIEENEEIEAGIYHEGSAEPDIDWDDGEYDDYFKREREDQRLYAMEQEYENRDLLPEDYSDEDSIFNY